MARLPQIKIPGAERAQQILDSAVGHAETPGRACTRVLHIGVFFDVVGHNAKKDPTDRWSNIGLLWRAFPLRLKEKCIPVYIPGLAAKFESDSASYFKAVAAAVAKEKVGGAEDELKKKLAQGKVKDIFVDAQQIPEKLRKSAERAMGGARMARKNPVLGLVRGGRSAARFFKSQLWTVPLSVATAVPFLRDSRALMGYNLGVDVRVNYALAEVLARIAEHVGEITEVRVYAYGAERGGSLARMFVNALQGMCRRTPAGLTLQNTDTGGRPVPLRLPFLGLFDSISSLATTDEVQVLIRDGFGALSPVPLPEDAIDGELEVGAAVASTYHLVAGHEVRGYQRIDSLRKAGGPVRERVLPGSSGDVTGDLGGKTRPTDLAKLALWLMYQTSLAQKVPFLAMEQLQAQDKATANRYYLTQTVSVAGKTLYADDLLAAYERWLGATGSLEAAFQAHMCAWLPWLKQQLPKHSDGSIGKTRYLDWNPDAVKRGGQAPASIQDILDRRTSPLVQDLRTIRAGAKPNAALWKAWEQGQPPSPEVAALFEFLVHDPYEADVNRGFWMLLPASAAFNYFRVRELDDGNAEPLLTEEDRAREALNKQASQSQQQARQTAMERQKTELSEINRTFQQQREQLLKQGKSTAELDQAYQGVLKQKTDSYKQELERLG